MSFLANPYGHTGLGQVQQRQAALAAQQNAYLQAQNQAYAANQGSSTVPSVIGVGSGTGIITFGTCTSVTSASSLYVTAGTSSGTAIGSLGLGTWGVVTKNGPLRIDDGQPIKIELPDGTIIDVKADGSFTIEDKAAKVIYRAARMRDFNPFINVSDRLEQFIEFCGKQGVRQGEMLELPINLFIGWLAIEAARADKEPDPAIPLLPDLRKRMTPRCPGCGRFTLAEMRVRHIEFCAPPCFERHYRRQVKALPAPMEVL